MNACLCGQCIMAYVHMLGQGVCACSTLMSVVDRAGCLCPVNIMLYYIPLNLKTGWPPASSRNLPASTFHSEGATDTLYNTQLLSLLFR